VSEDGPGPRAEAEAAPRAAQPRRRAGRRPGSDDTRGRILASAREAFAERGFDGATVREVAARAEVDPALVHHYFGSKQRLFVAAMEFPVDVGQVFVAVAAGPPGEIGERVVRTFLGIWDRPSVRQLILGIVRSATTDATAAAMFRTVLVEGPLRAMTATIDAPDGALRATLVGTQLIGLTMARYVVVLEPLASLDVEALASLVGPTVTRYLTGDVGDLVAAAPAPAPAAPVR